MQTSSAPPIPSTLQIRTGRRHRAVLWTRFVGQGVLYLVLVLGALAYLMPFWWMFITSVKTLEEIFRYPPTLIPESFTLAAYKLAWEYSPWILYLRNTLFIMITTLFGVVLTSSLCAYGFACRRFRGRDIVFVVMLASMMLPSQVTLIPTYVFFHRLGWLNTFKPLIIPAWFGGGAFNIFLMRQFFTSIPVDLVDAARIDGSSSLGIWWRVMMPLSKPALTAITVFTVQGTWNDFFGPLIYLNSRNKLTLALALQMFQATVQSAGDYKDVGLYPATMAASTVVTLPVIILFVLAQKYFVEGIQMTGLKG